MDGRGLSCLDARLELGAAAAAAARGTLGYTVISVGELPIMLGEAFEIERLCEAGWERVQLPFMFRLWGWRLDAEDRYELSARVPELAPGRCRLRKRLAVARDPHPGYEWVAGQEIEPIEVTGEFDVTAE